MRGFVSYPGYVVYSIYDLTRIKDNRVSNFESKEWMNSKVGLIKVKVLVKSQHKDVVNC